jgi:hypothetical protein
VHKSLLGEFLENWCSKSYALLKNINEFLCCFLICVPIWMKSGVRYLHVCSTFVSSVIVSTGKAILFLWAEVAAHLCKYRETI